MLHVLEGIVVTHDLSLVILAVAICFVASYGAFCLLQHVERSTGAMRWIWLWVAGIASGFGIWATHFIAMLAYSPGIQSSYHIGYTLLSLLAAIVLTTLSFSVALASQRPSNRWVGGVMVGGGIAAMHYIGMAALEIQGRIKWYSPLVVASIVLASLFGVLALLTGLSNKSRNAIGRGAALLVLAICSLHFTAMSAVTIVRDSAVDPPSMSIPNHWIVILVTVASLTIFALAQAGFALDVRERRQALRQMEKMNSLANGAFEGLLVCEGSSITTANISIAELAGCSVERLIGRDLAAILPDQFTRQWLEDKPCIAVETMLRPIAGEPQVAVEVIARPISLDALWHRRVIAVRDLRGRNKAEQDIYFLSHHDTLTGLVNRTTFNRELELMLDAHGERGQLSGKHLAVLCLDLDRFKDVNDVFGHAAGDELLQKVARCSQQVLRRGQLMARLGGDEFAISIPGLQAPGQAERIATDLLHAFENENRKAVEAGALISASIGIAFYPGDAPDSATLMNRADAALYRAKADGRGSYRFFDAALGQEMRDRQRLQHDLRMAIGRQELSIVYQPLVCAKNREVFGFEALLRWSQEGRGSISPSVFIPLAEECGLIVPIGEWVLQQVCQEAAGWERPLSVSVNVSAVQLHSPYFAKNLSLILSQTGLLPERLELEITETVLIRDPCRALTMLRQLKEIGVNIAIDDFGTGYSSLSNLRTFPFDKIKIDGSFIRTVNANQQTASIVRAVLSLGRSLELPVLAEGVETEEELVFLNMEACQQAQGYLFGRPGPIQDFRYLTRQKFCLPIEVG